MKGLKCRKTFGSVEATHSFARIRIPHTDCSFKGYCKLLRKKLLNRVGIVSILFLGLILLSFLKIVPYPNEEDLTALLPRSIFSYVFWFIGKSNRPNGFLLTVTSPCFTILFIGRKNDPQWV